MLFKHLFYAIIILRCVILLLWLLSDVAAAAAVAAIATLYVCSHFRVADGQTMLTGLCGSCLSHFLWIACFMALKIV